MALKKPHLAMFTLSALAFTSCAQEGSFFQKGSRKIDAETDTADDTADAKYTMPPPHGGGDFKKKKPDHKDKKSHKDEMQDLEGGGDLMKSLLGQFGDGGFDPSKLGSLGDLIGLLIPGFTGSGGLGGLAGLLSALGGGNGSILDLFQIPQGSGGSPGQGVEGIFAKVSTQPKTDDSERMDSFCTAAQVVQSKSQSLPTLLAEICDGETANSPLITKFIKNAYDGSSSLKFHTFKPLSSDERSQTTTVRYGFALKLPSTARDHFDGVAPMQFDPEGLKAFVQLPGGTATVSILENYENDGDYHVRGILARQKLVKKVMGLSIPIESETRYDHYMLEDDKYYLYTSTIIKPIVGINATDTLSLVIQDGDNAYLIALVDIESPNQGFATYTEIELETSAKISAEALYEAVLTDAE